MSTSTKLLILSVALVAGALSIFLLAGPPVHSQSYAPPPTVEGFGSGTTGGKGGPLIRVTSLADSGSGSLRWALEDIDGPRNVIFDVSGIIALQSQIEISGNVTVDGRSSPGGITIVGARLRVVGDNVILQGLRIRPGDGPGMPAESRDAISIGTAEQEVSRVVIDGNSLTWAIDETLSIWGAVTDVTVSNNIIAEALDMSIHPKGRHSMGLLIGGGKVARVTIVANLFAHNRHRNPAVQSNSEQIEFVNNLVYNWGPNGFEAEGGTLHVIGNNYVSGPDTVPRAPIRFGEAEGEKAEYFVADNFGDVTPSDRLRAAPVFQGSGVSPVNTADVERYVLARVGARSPALDAIDQRIIKDVVARTGRIIDSQDEVGGYDQTGDGMVSAGR